MSESIGDLEARLWLRDELTAAIKAASDTVRKETADMAKQGQANVSSLAATFGQLKAAVAAYVSFRALQSYTRQAVAEAAEAEDAEIRLGLAIRNRADAATFSIEKMRELAKASMALTGIDDDVFKQAQAILLRFESVNAANFEKVNSLLADYAALTGSDIPSAAIILGRALEYPGTAMRALQRAGITLSKQQREHMQELIQTGQLERARAEFLDTLAKKTVGSAEALSRGAKQAFMALRTAWGNFLEDIGKGELLDTIAKAARDIAAQISRPEFVQLAQRLGKQLADGIKLVVPLIVKAAENLETFVRAARAFLALKVAEGFSSLADKVSGLALKMAGMAGEAKAAATAVNGLGGALVLLGSYGISSSNSVNKWLMMIGAIAPAIWNIVAQFRAADLALKANPLYLLLTGAVAVGAAAGALLSDWSDSLSKDIAALVKPTEQLKPILDNLRAATKGGVIDEAAARSAGRAISALGEELAKATKVGSDTWDPEKAANIRMTIGILMGALKDMADAAQQQGSAKPFKIEPPEGWDEWMRSIQDRGKVDAFTRALRDQGVAWEDVKIQAAAYAEVLGKKLNPKDGFGKTLFDKLVDIGRAEAATGKLEGLQKEFDAMLGSIRPAAAAQDAYNEGLDKLVDMSLAGIGTEAQRAAILEKLKETLRGAKAEAAGWIQTQERMLALQQELKDQWKAWDTQMQGFKRSTEDSLGGSTLQRQERAWARLKQDNDEFRRGLFETYKALFATAGEAEYLADAMAKARFQSEAVKLVAEELVNSWRGSFLQLGEFAVENLQRAFSGIFSRILTEGKFTWKSLGNALVDVFKATISELIGQWMAFLAKKFVEFMKEAALERAIARKNAALESSGQSGNIPGGNASASGWAKMFQGAKTWWAKYGSAANIIGTAAVIGLLAYGAWSMKKRREEMQRGISVGGVSVSGLDVRANFDKVSQEIAAGIRSLMDGLKAALGGAVLEMKNWGVEIMKLSKEGFRATVEGQIIGYFKTWQEAMVAAFRQASRNIVIPPELKGVFAKALADIGAGADPSILKERMDEIKALQDLASGLTDLEIKMRTLIPDTRALIQHLQELGMTFKDASQLAYRVSAANMASWRNQITGHQMTAKEELAQRKQQAAIFNAQLVLLRLEIKAEIDRLKARLAGAKGRARIDGIEVDIEDRFLKARARQEEARAELYQQSNEWIAAQINELQKIYDSLPKPIDFGEIRVGGRGAGGFGAGVNKFKQAVDEFKSAQEDVKRAIRDILLGESTSALTDRERLQQAYTDFMNNLNAAKGGNLGAAGQVGSMLQQLIEMAKAFTGGGNLGMFGFGSFREFMMAMIGRASGFANMAPPKHIYEGNAVYDKRLGDIGERHIQETKKFREQEQQQNGKLINTTAAVGDATIRELREMNRMISRGLSGWRAA